MSQSSLQKSTPTLPYSIILVIILLLAFALRMMNISQTRMWGDEGFSVYSASRDLYAITFELKDVDPHPPLYYYLLHFYLPLGGFSELSIRFFSAIFGTATVALIYSIGKRMFDKRTGALAAAILAMAPFAVHYSQEVRMYALVMFLGAVAMWFFSQITNYELRITSHASRIRHHDSPRAPRNSIWLGFFFSMSLTQYSLYQAAFIFVAQGVFLLPFLKRRFGFIVRWLAVSIAIVLLFIPWLLAHSGSALTDIQGVAGDTTPMNVFTFLARGFAAISVGTTIPLSNAFTLAGLFLIVIIIGLGVALVTHQAQINDWLLVAFVAVPMISLYPIYFVAPLYRGRLFALALVPLMLLLSRSSMLIVQRARFAAIPIALLVVGVSAYSLNDYYFRYDRYSAVVEDYLPAIHDIEQRAQPGDVVLFHAYWQQGYFLSHYHGAPLTYGSVEKQSDLDSAVAKPRNVWAIIQALPHHGVEDWLAQNAFPLGERDYGQMRVLSYRTGAPAVGETLATPIVFDNGMSLLGYHINGDTPIESGRGAVMLQLDWQAAQNITSDYIISVRATNIAGNIVWAQDDSQPSSGTFPTTTWQPGQFVTDRHAFVIPPGTPPGSYRIRVVLYDSKSGRVANIISPDNQRGQSIATGSVSVSRPTGVAMPITPTVPLDIKWNEIALIGFDGMSQEISAGDTFPLTLYWRALQKPTRDYLVNVLVFDSTSGWRAASGNRLANTTFPTSAWNVGETWVDKFQLTVDRLSDPGNASIVVFLTDEKSDETLPVQTNLSTRDLDIKGSVSPQNARVHAVQIATVKINTREHHFDLPLPKNPLMATLDSKIKLLGFDLDSGTIKPGSTISLTLYWQAVDLMSERYTVFVHLVDASGKLVAQRDSEPLNGTAPTPSWLYNEVVTDPYKIDLPTNLASGEYSLIVGMYNASRGGNRLVVNETNLDSVPLTKIKVGAP